MSVIGSPIVAGGSTNKLNAASVAAAYNPNSLYDVGDLVTYKGGFYKCKTAIETAEAWNAAHWDVVTLEDLLDEKVAKESGKGLSTNDFTNADKQKLAGIEDMSAAEANAGSATTGRLVSAAVIAGAIDSKKGVANGIAELDASGRVPAAQLPSFVDDVLDGYLYNGKFYAEQAHTTELTAEDGKIYIDKETNKQYRWSGSAYAEISSSLALGETASTAYAGNKGKEAHDLAEAALPKTGGTMSGNIAMGSHKITGLADGENDSDAVNKGQLDEVEDAIPAASNAAGAAAGTAAVGVSDDYARADHVHPHDSTKLDTAGGSMTGNIAMGDNKVTGLADPTANQDAANKKYVDDEIAKLTVDSELSDTSEKPVQNKVAKAGIDEVQTNLDKLGFSVDQNGALNQTAGNDTAVVLKDSTGKRIRDAIRKLAGTYDFTDYKSITAAVRNGDGAKVPNGTTFTVPHSVYGNIDFVVRRKNVDKVYNDANRPTMTIQIKNLLSNNGGSSVKTFQYDRPEAFYSVTEEIAAGSVCKFTAPRTYNGWVAGDYHFTAEAAIPVGSKLRINGDYNKAFTTAKIDVYANAKATSTSAQYAIEEGDGEATIDLGTLESNLNHYYRILWGSNNAEESNIHQWLNGKGLMSDIWTPKTQFDMMCTEYTTLHGFLEGFPQDFLDCLGLCAVHNITNDSYEAPDAAHAKSTEYTYNAYFWLPSRKEIYGTNENAREDSESQFAYYADIGTTNADKLMYAKGAASPTSYWLRTPYAGHASSVRFCYTGYGGALHYSTAFSSHGVAPLAILA